MVKNENVSNTFLITQTVRVFSNTKHERLQGKKQSKTILWNHSMICLICPCQWSLHLAFGMTWLIWISTEVQRHVQFINTEPNIGRPSQTDWNQSSLLLIPMCYYRSHVLEWTSTTLCSENSIRARLIFKSLKSVLECRPYVTIWVYMYMRPICQNWSY